MSRRVMDEQGGGHRERADIPNADTRREALPNFNTGEAPMARADIRKPDEREAWRGEVAKTIERVRALSGLNLNEFAEAVGRDPRQVSRWLKGEERPHIDAILASEQLQEPMLVALAERLGRVKVTTQITVERRIA